MHLSIGRHPNKTHENQITSIKSKLITHILHQEVMSKSFTEPKTRQQTRKTSLINQEITNHYPMPRQINN